MLLRNFCFTLNNPDDNGGESCKKFLQSSTSYYVLGRERGDGGTYHWQGYAELTRRTRATTVFKVCGWHCEARRGTAQQAADYCKKDGDYEEAGIMSAQGLRNDLDATRRLCIDDGMRGVTRQCNLQQIRIAEKFLTYNEPPRNFKPTVFYIWGESGVGKSRLARALCSDDTYTKNDTSQWWDGYDGHECLILDDFRDSWMPMTEILSILDRYEKQLPVKGGFRQLRASTIVITSVIDPDKLYANVYECKYQIYRRIWCVIHMT